MHLVMVVAQAIGSTGTLPPPGQQGQAPQGIGALGQMLPLVIVMIGIFYFLVLRPQRKQEKAHQAMLKDLKKGDKVVTIGGIHGVVHSVREDAVTLKVDESGAVRVSFSRSAISRVIDRDEAGAESKADASKGV